MGNSKRGGVVNLTHGTVIPPRSSTADLLMRRTLLDVQIALNIVAAVGLSMRTSWGIVLFLAAFGSQFVIYTVFIRHFTVAAHHRQTIHGFLDTEAVLFAGFVAVWFLRRWNPR